MTHEEIIDKVAAKLESDYGYDFSTDFWTDETLLLLKETIVSTVSVINDKDAKAFPCLNSKQVCDSQCPACKFVEEGFKRCK